MGSSKSETASVRDLATHGREICKKSPLKRQTYGENQMLGVHFAPGAQLVCRTARAVLY